MLHHVSDVGDGQKRLHAAQTFFTLGERQQDVQTVLPCQSEFPNLKHTARVCASVKLLLG